MMKLCQAVDASIILTVTDSHNAHICNQMSIVLWGFEMVRFPNDCFVQIGGVHTYSELEIS